MTFRSRVIVATALAAALAVVLACTASFVATRNALLDSVDASLVRASQQGQDVEGSFSQLVLANGASYPPALPADATILSYAKSGTGQILRTVTIGGEAYRELIKGLPAGTQVSTATGLVPLSMPAAQIFVVNFSGQVAELRRLLVTLIIVAVGVMVLSLLFGVILARNALHPLEEVTDEIETIAETSDVTRRLEEGDEDELGRLRKVFNELLDTIDASQSLQRQLVLDASHELRTPLTSLRTNASVLQRIDRLTPDDLQQVSVDMVLQVDELAALVTDLAELARGERSEGPLVELHLDECVDEFVDVARTHARVKNIDIQVFSSPSIINGRRDRLERAVSNLLTNAVKFTPEGGHIRVETHDGIVVVADSGSGVSDVDIPFVFDRFWRSPQSRGLPGSGLGLSIVDQVVDEFGGAVSVDRDEALGGARFTMSFPTA